jgi:hypothetical protein
MLKEGVIPFLRAVDWDAYPSSLSGRKPFSQPMKAVRFDSRVPHVGPEVGRPRSSRNTQEAARLFLLKHAGHRRSANLEAFLGNQTCSVGNLLDVE